MKKLIIIFALLILSTQAYGVTWTTSVTQAGGGTCEDGGLCSATEFNNLSGDYAGSTFNFSGTFSTRISVSIYGTSGNPVILDGYSGGDTAPLTDVWASSNGALLNQGMHSDPVAYLIVQDFRMTQTSGTLPGFYSYNNGINHFIFRRNYISDCNARNFQIGDFIGNNSHHIIIEENKSTNFSMGSVGENQNITFVETDHVLVRNNSFGHDDLANTKCISCNTVTVHGSDDMLFEYNNIYGAPQQAGVAIKECPGCTQSRHIYRFNILRDNNELGLGWAGGNDLLNYFYFYGNKVYSTGDIGITAYDLADNSYWWSNVIHDNGNHGFIVFDARTPSIGNPDNTFVYNNTFARNGGDDPSVVGRAGISVVNGTNIIVKNNLLYNNRPGSSLYYNQIYNSTNCTYDYNTLYHPLGTATWYYMYGFRTLAEMQAYPCVLNCGTQVYQEENGLVVDLSAAFTNPIGDDGIYGTADDDYSLATDTLTDGEDLDPDDNCIPQAVDLSGGDAWMVTNSGYGRYIEVCLGYGLDPETTDWTTIPPTVGIKQRGVGGVAWERGAYVYGAGVNVTPPELVTATIPAAGTTLVCVFDEDVVENNTGEDWAFTMSGGAVGLTWLSTSSVTITYTLSRTVGSHETLSSLAYTQPGAGIQDLAENDLATIADASAKFTNSSAADTVPPELSSVTIPAAGTTVIFDFSETITEDGDGSNWYVFTMSGGDVELSGSVVDDDAVTYTMSRTVRTGETLTELDYAMFEPDTGGDGYVDGIEDTSGNELLPIDNYSGTFNNNSTVEATAPTVTQVDIEASGTSIKITLSETVVLGTSDGSDWKLIMDGSATEIAMSSPSLDDDEITYTLNRTVLSTESLSELDFTQDGYGIQDSVGNFLASINNYALTFNNNSTQLPAVGMNVEATDNEAREQGQATGTYTFSCTPTCGSVVVNWTLSGTADLETGEQAGDYNLDDEDGAITINGASGTLTLTPVDDAIWEAIETAILTITPDAAYTVGTGEATINIRSNDGDIEGAKSMTGVSVQ